MISDPTGPAQHLLPPKPASDCDHSAAFGIESQMPGGERDILRSKWILPAPVPLHLPASPKDTHSEIGITVPLCQSLINKQAQVVGWVLGHVLLSLGEAHACAHASTHTHTHTRSLITNVTYCGLSSPTFLLTCEHKQTHIHTERFCCLLFTNTESFSNTSSS